jgi:hypothetical protein
VNSCSRTLAWPYRRAIKHVWLLSQSHLSLFTASSQKAEVYLGSTSTSKQRNHMLFFLFNKFEKGHHGLAYVLLLNITVRSVESIQTHSDREILETLPIHEMMERKELLWQRKPTSSAALSTYVMTSLPIM